MRNNNHSKIKEITSPILSLKITSIDDDGFANANILDSHYDFRQVEIPFKNENIKFNYVKQHFKPVAYESSVEGKTDLELTERMNYNIIENGEWRDSFVFF